MARAIERIEQDIAAMEEAITLLQGELDSAYSKYLTLLGQAVQQQLVLASYQICTHGYPQSFLNLSFSQRQQLQQELRKLGKQAREQLVNQLEMLKQLAEAELEESKSIEPTPEPSSTHQECSEETQSELLPESIDSEDETPTPPNPPKPKPAKQPKIPPTKLEQLMYWLEELEDAIAQTLQTTSLNTNHLLQKSGIIPEKLPAALLEAAAKAEASSDSPAGSPNLLNLLMETPNEDEEEDSTLLRVVAINLRLSEIEFADPSLMASRNQIRSLVGRVSKFKQEYHKIQRERAVAQAEAAWRLSWYED
ncbi:MAG TPA: hypothetical protein V6C95_24095 [Coleofasciculaceae cyanobacterium]